MLNDANLASVSIVSSSLRANSSEILCLMLRSRDSILEFVFSYPLGPYNASAPSSFLLADYICTIVAIVISTVSC